MTSSVRHLMPFKDKMAKYHGEMEFALYAAEQLCHTDKNGEKCAEGCPFESENGVHCDLKWIRSILGDHVPPGEPVKELGVCEHGEVQGKEVLCRSPDGCEYQMFGDDTDPVFCMREDIILESIKELEAWQEASLHDIAAWEPDGTEAGK